MPKPPPSYRRLRTYTYDPSLATQLSTALINQTVLLVPWEYDHASGRDLLEPGPVGDYLDVIDYDPASECFYEPVDLNDPYLLSQDGIAPSEGNPKFHQQMVYAVAMVTIANFERALGRKALWAPRLVRDPQTHEVVSSEPVLKLRIYPHALREANAYYSPEKKALLFGYFPSTLSGSDEGLPGGLVFTCLSQDVVAHETTHALLDGVHRYFAEPSNPDVFAFHEGFADVVALFQHFSQAEALRNQIAKTRGDLRDRSLLGELAHQFGQAIGNHGALRDYIGTYDAEKKEWKPRIPKATDYPSADEPHDRGAVLVAALFDAFLSIYEERTSDLIRIATGGRGILPQGRIHPDLVNRLASEASKSATRILRMAIRALDYCPPVDITFGEYLRALITGDADLVPEDHLGYRIAIIEAFRRRGIYPPAVRVLGEDVLRWQPPPDNMPDFSGLILALKNPKNVPTSLNVPDAPGLPTLEWGTTGRREDIDQRTDRYRMLTWLWMNDMLGGPKQGRPPMSSFDSILGLSLKPNEAPPTIYRSKKIYRGKKEKLPTLEVYSVRSARRPEQDGRTKTDLVIGMAQRRRGYFDQDRQKEADRLPFDSPKFEAEFKPDFIFRGGCTLLIDGESGVVRYTILKRITDNVRLARQASFAADQFSPTLRATYEPGGDSSILEPFAMLHRS